MALSIPLPETFPMPSVAYGVCAACGPLGEAVAQRAGLSLAAEPGLRCKARLYEVALPIAFPTLRRWVAASAQVREALELIESLRCQEVVKKRLPTHAELAGRARAALLLSKGNEFRRLYGDYIRTSAYEWHPDPEHTLFWDSVLGPGWGGVDAIPPGEARKEILVLLANAYALFSPPVENSDGMLPQSLPDGEDWLKVAAALRVADAESLELMQQEGSAAARAASQLLAGRWDAAQVAFQQLFGSSEDSRYLLVQSHGLPLMTYALVAGVLSGGNLRFLRAWFHSARYAVQYVFPPSMASEQGEVMRFLDHLEQVDDLVNRRGRMVEPPRFNGALSCLPFALVYGALPHYVRQVLHVEAMADAVAQLGRSGLSLLARYGGAGMLQAPKLPAELRTCLEALPKAGVPSPQLPAPATYRALTALKEMVQKHASCWSSLYQARWSLPPTLVASRTETGVVIVLADEEYLEECDDSPVLRCMKKHAQNGLLTLEGASPTEFTRLFAAMGAQVDVAGSLAVENEEVAAAEPQPVLLLTHEGGTQCLAALRLRLLPESSLLLAPCCGLGIPVLETVDGHSVPVCRNMEEEGRLVNKTARALCRAGCEEAAELRNGIIQLETFEKLSSLLRACRSCGIECYWEKEHTLHLHQPQGGLRLHSSEAAQGWLELGGGLPVDEGRVLELSSLLQAFAERRGNTLCLGDGEYVMLNPSLERQLALLELIWQEKRGRQGVATAALPLLSALEVDGVSAAPVQPSAAALPEGLQARLRAYQAEGYRWLAERVERGVGALLADDMGLGKTVQVLALLLHVSEKAGAGPSLVIAPVSLLGNWAEEAARFAPTLKVRLFEPKKAEPLAALSGGELVLASYGQVVTQRRVFAAHAWELLVLDEAQAIKNPDAQRAKAVCSLRARGRLCLTGTPVENSLLDLWSQMHFLNPGLFGSRASFQRRFRKAREEETSLLRQVLAPLVLRRTKSEVLTQLPPLTETIEWVEFSSDERALYESLRRSAMKKWGTNKEGGIGILAELMRLRRACCHGKLVLADFTGPSAKLAAVVERVKELRAAGRRVLVFSQFTDVLDMAQESLHAEEISVLRLDGSTPAAQRRKAVSAFQKGGADAFLISLKAGGAGLNLTAADYVMLLDPWWNSAVEAQAAGRSHRMGQAQPVTLCRFIVRDTVEERILEMHRDKNELAESILHGNGEGLTLASLRSLLGA